MPYITINTHTNGKYRTKKINGRELLVTTMRPIRGNTSMNKIFYPDKQIQNSYMQFNNMLTPSGHPKVNGKSVSAFHPMAINSNHIGGSTENPRKKGKDVFVDFVLDVEVANKSDDGKELIRRIKNGDKVGVSTGLTINQFHQKSGVDDFGKPYNVEGEGFNFDHIAILLNEKAAGDHAGTELVLNEEMNEEITIIDLDKMTVPSKNPEQNENFNNTNTKVDDMDKKLFIMALLANGLTTNSEEELTAMSETQLAKLFKPKPVSVENAKTVMTKDGFDFKGYTTYTENKEGFEVYQVAEKTKLDLLRKDIVANSEYTDEMVANKDEDELNLLTKAFVKTSKPTKRAGTGVTNIHTNSNSSEVQLDYSM